jgi:DMSO/TMAO reductase YedYZ molybdopterin-dependent catalytic subunit
MIAAIDCHNGWYSLQAWKGVSLARLLEKTKIKENVTGIRMISVTGLANTYPLSEAHQILLATHVSGEVLDASHGFPLRAVVPGRRAWFWMKWLARIEVLSNPIEVVSGILCTPFQVFRELDSPRVSTDIR